MITIDKHPSSIVFAGNPVRFNVTSDNAYSNSGSEAILNMVFSGTPDRNYHHFTMNFDYKSIEFSLVSNLANGPYYLLMAQVNDTYFSWAWKMYESLLQVYELRNVFEITIGDDTGSQVTVTLKAREKGAKHSVTITDSNITGVSFSSTAGVDPVMQDDFSVIMNLWNGVDPSIGSDMKTVDESGKVSFNIADYLLSKLSLDESSRFHFPERGTQVYFERKEMVVEYSASFAERYGGVVYRMFLDDVRYAIAGGLSREALVFFNDKDQAYFDAPSNKKRFLTWAPLVKQTTRNMTEKLYWLLVDTGDLYFDLCGIIHYVDGTSDNMNSVSISFTQTVSVIEIEVGYHRLKIGAYQPSKVVKSWEVWIENTNGVASEVRRFEIDEVFRENERRFLFRNSLSGYDTFRCLGVQESNVDYERSEAMQVLDAVETSQNAPKVQYNLTEEQKFKANSGWVTAEQKQWLRDLLISDEIYEIVGTRLFKVVIDSKKAFLFKDQEYLYALEFEYSRAYTDKYYSSVGGQRALTADNGEVTADTTLITADQTTY